VAADSNVESTLTRLREPRRKARGFQLSGKGPFLVSVPVAGQESKRLGLSEAHAFIWQAANSRLAYILGLKEDTEYLLRVLRQYLPGEFAPVFLLTDDFRKSFDLIGKSDSSVDIRIVGYTSNVLSDEETNLKTRREWLATAKPFDDFFEGLTTERQWLRSVWLRATQRVETEDEQDSQRCAGRLRRDMTFSCDFGFRFFFDTIIEGMFESVVNSRKLYLDRGATSSPTGAPRPLQIIYDDQLFHDKAQNKRLVHVLKKMTDCGVSVFHGNPYLHASLLDYGTGSSFTIWITDSNAIRIIPELKASPGAFQRLCNYITEHFAEGRIEEVKSLSDSED
jgi:hypothetical protein